MQTQTSIAERLQGWASEFESRLAAELSSMLAGAPTVPPRLTEAVRYALLNGGKRVRAYIITRMCELCGGTAEQAVPAAGAIECVHAFSLVHDDLPAMDNDDFRRGRPTCHKAFGEALAILAGDALFALAFEILGARMGHPHRAAAAMTELARGTGWAGMTGGQVLDVLHENEPPRLELVEQIHACKTGRLFECAARLGAISAGATPEQTAAAGEFGRHLGLAFQIADDLLDVTGSAAALGKAVAKDASAGKQTYPAAAGVAASQQAARSAAERAAQALTVFGPPAEDLRELARFVVERQR